MLNIAFFGTSDKSTPIIEELHNNFKLKLCVTKNDTVAGRKKIIRETEVKKWGKRNNVPVVEINNLKNENLSLIKTTLLNYNIELCIVSDFSFIIPNEIISIPKYGMINVHFSLLPKYRGASPIQHTILNNETETGVTFQKIDSRMDTGDILCQFKHKLQGTETTHELINTLYLDAAKNLTQCINKYVNGDIRPQKQSEKDATYCYSKTHPKSTLVYKEDAKINWNDDIMNIYAMIRAFCPWPIAHTSLYDMKRGLLKCNSHGVCFNSKCDKCIIFNTAKKDLMIKIYKAHVAEINGCATLCIDEIQVEGRNIMKWRDFINGYALR